MLQYKKKAVAYMKSLKKVCSVSMFAQRKHNLVAILDYWFPAFGMDFSQGEFLAEENGIHTAVILLK